MSSLQNPSQTRLILALKKAKRHYTTRRQTMMDEFDKKVEQDKKDELSKGKLKAAFKKLRIRDFAPMLYLREFFHQR